MTNPDMAAHTRGASPYVDDCPEPAGLLHATVVPSAAAHGIVRAIDTDAARTGPGDAAVLTAADIPGENQIGAILFDEPLLAEGLVHYVGEPVALVVAETPEQARDAALRVRVEIEPLDPVFDPREAAARGSYIAPSRTIDLGDVDAAWARCALVVGGRVDSGGQEHLYLETQAAMAMPLERGRMRVLSGTQGPTAVQRGVARVLGLRMNDVEVEVPRLGGGFGGKEDQATVWACLAALGAAVLARPVKIVLRRNEDMAMTGKRHPYSSDFRLGVGRDLKILAFEATYYQNSGAYADLSTAVLERTLLHATNSYFIPHVRVTGHCCRTNLPPNTALRGFGGPQGMFVIESAITKAADALGVPARAIQRANLLREGDTFPCGMAAESARAERCFDEAASRFDVEGRAREAAAFNAAHRLRKRGLAVMPVCFGISFTNTMMNQAGALAHVYQDGSVSVSTAAVEMGQGVNAKIRIIAARTLGITEDWVTVERTNTTRVANTSPTAASAGADLNGMAVRLACRQILARLHAVAASLTGAPAESILIREGLVFDGDRSTGTDWKDLVRAASSRRVDLTAHAHYATPGIQYDRESGKGRPFAYHVFGTALVEATVDVLRGTCRIESVRAVHDGGRSLDPLVDRGQAEGAIVQGLGWMILEDLVHDERGAVVSGSMTTYKVPDIHFSPREIEVDFLEDADNPEAVMHSKAIGEPPLMYGIGAYFAVLAALREARPGASPFFHAPMTNERILSYLTGSPDRLDPPGGSADHSGPPWRGADP